MEIENKDTEIMADNEKPLVKKLTAKQIAHRKRLAERRKKGFDRYNKKRRKEAEVRKEKERKRKEREKAKRTKEREEKKHKRPVGRPKKRGRKKKHKSYYVKKPKVIIRPVIDFKVVDCRNNKQIRFIGQYSKVEDAYNVVNTLLKEDEKIIFPSKVIHSDTVGIPVYEYLILEKNRDGTKKPPMMRNEFGKLVEQKTTSETWVILDKFKHTVEETFWVWGFNNRTERKTFEWIYYNILIGGIETKYDIKRVILYRNKILIKNDDGSMDMIICKMMSDAIRMYNLMEEWVNKTKNKQVFFLGSYNKHSEKRKALELEIMEMTGWNRAKVQMTSTSKHLKK